MGYRKYTGVQNAADILNKIRDAVLAEGWTILVNCIPDTAIDGSGVADGIRLVMKSPDSKIFATFRSANGMKIFDTQINETNAYGIGLICHDAFTQNPAQGLWYNQPNAPLIYGSQEVIGVGVPVNPSGNYDVYINIIHDPGHMMVISIEDKSGANGAPGTTPQNVFQHLAVGSIEKVGDWDGGMIFSGSRSSYAMFTQSTTFQPDAIELETTPLFSMSAMANTFARADIDGAPTRNPAVLWASSGKPEATAAFGYTGKQLALPVKKLDIKGQAWEPKIPDYTFLQSQAPTDPGRDVNTLNCISVNEPMTVYFLVDPDELRNFSPAGYIAGVYFISLKNVAPGQVYDINYPESGNLHQVFPYTRRRGIYGYDGFSVKQ